MVMSSLSQKVKNLKGFPREIGEFLIQENFSQEEVEVLPLFFEKKVRSSKEEGFVNNSQRIASIETLVNKNILKKKDLGDDTVYYLESVEKFFAWIRNNAQRKVKKVESQAQTFIDILRSSLGDAVQSEVTFYEGIEGIKDSYRHILDNAKEEICAYFSVVETVPKFQFEVQQGKQ